MSRISAQTRRLRFLTLTATLGVLAGLLAPAAASAGTAGAPENPTPTWIQQTMLRMTLEEKVGQLFVTNAYGETADTTNPADVAANQTLHGVNNGSELLNKYKLGGIIYFAWTNSVKNPPQIAGLSNGLQRVALSQRVPIPLLITTDQEQGVVTRVGPPATSFPGNMALGASRSSANATSAASIGGQELRSIGINQNYAPVADVNVNALNPVIGVRSFASDPALVASNVSAQVKGYQGANVAATAKHFPGHGDTNVDSHTGIPIITHTRAEWESIDKPPFAAAIADRIDAIMTAHIIVPALDPSGDPATLSRPILTGILRDEMGYDGVIVTDSLGMAGVRQKYGDDRVPVLALKAGVDQLLMPPSLDLAYNAVLKAVATGELTEQRIDQSVRRILKLKHKRGLVANAYVDPSKIASIVGTPAHYAAAQAVTDKTITLVKNDASVLPIAPVAGKKVLVTGAGVAVKLALAVGKRGVTADALDTGTTPTQATIDAAVAAARTHDVTVVATNRAWSNVAQQTLVKALLDTGKPVIVTAVRDPYDIAYFPAAATYVATYSTTDVSLESLTRVLFGEIAPAGKLPVMIPAAGAPATVLYPYGHGLSL